MPQSYNSNCVSTKDCEVVSWVVDSDSYRPTQLCELMNEPPDVGSFKEQKNTVTFESRLCANNMTHAKCAGYTDYVGSDLATRVMRTKHVHNLRAQIERNCAN